MFPLLLIAACSGAPAAPRVTPVPIPPGPTTLVYSDAEKTRLAAENIDFVYCAEPPRPDWCSRLRRIGKTPDVSVTSTSLFVGTTMGVSAKARDIAGRMCSAIAGASFDDNAQPIGYYHVHIESKTGEALADCDVAR